MTYFIAIVPAVIILISTGLGFIQKNWFIELGLAIVIVSSITSIMQAIKNGRNAAKANKLKISDFIQEVDRSESYSFKHTSAMMGANNHNPVGYLQSQIDELQKKSTDDEKDFRALWRTTEVRLDICFGNLRYHENATLPKILGQGSGVIILSSIMTILGSAFLAFPDENYSAALNIAASINALLSNINDALLRAAEAK